MEKYQPCLVEYQTRDMSKWVEKTPPNNSEPWLVLLAQDESTAQQNDGKKASCVYKGEHTLKKKGVGRGIHQSDVICSTFGWLKDASQSLEYSKDYKGYWTGEMFVKQVGLLLTERSAMKSYIIIFVQLKEKIIPVFKAAHGPGYQALIMVDHSQGHAAYAANALLTSWMNL